MSPVVRWTSSVLLAALATTPFAFSFVVHRSAVAPAERHHHRRAGRTTQWAAKAASRKKAKSKSKGGTAKSSGFGGGGAGGAEKKGTTDAAKALLARSEKLFEELEEVAAAEGASADEEDSGGGNSDSSDLILRYFIVAARLKGEKERQTATGAAKQLTDWVPVVQLAVLGQQRLKVQNEEFLGKTTSALARETLHALTSAVPSLKAAVSGPMLEYSAEPMSSFEKFIYVMYDKSFLEKGQEAMTRAEAAAAFEIDSPDEVDAGELKRQYRKLSAALHPDNNQGLEGAEAEAVAERFRKVQEAYIVLGSQVVSGGEKAGEEVGKNAVASWYESVGGGDRLDFMGPLEMGAVGKAARGAELGHALGGWSQAICGIEPDITQFFASRNAASKR